MANKDYFGIEIDIDKWREEADVIDKADCGYLSFDTFDLISSIRSYIKTGLVEAKWEEKE